MFFKPKLFLVYWGSIDNINSSKLKCIRGIFLHCFNLIFISGDKLFILLIFCMFFCESSKLLFLVPYYSVR